MVTKTYNFDFSLDTVITLFDSHNAYSTHIFMQQNGYNLNNLNLMIVVIRKILVEHMGLYTEIAT
jgi:hypothetical protein